jgi:hypothetical protein
LLLTGESPPQWKAERLFLVAGFRNQVWPRAEGNDNKISAAGVQPQAAGQLIRPSSSRLGYDDFAMKSTQGMDIHGDWQCVTRGKRFAQREHRSATKRRATVRRHEPCLTGPPHAPDQYRPVGRAKLECASHRTST